MATHRNTTGLPKATRLFAQIPLIWFELGLYKRMNRNDWLTLASLLNGTTRTKPEDPDNGKCCVMVSRILRENKGTSLQRPHHVEYCRWKLVEKVGLYKFAGYRKVALADRVVSVLVLRQRTGPEIWEFAREKGLISREWIEQRELQDYNRRERQRAAEAARKRKEAEKSPGSGVEAVGGDQGQQEPPEIGTDPQIEELLKPFK